MADKIGMPLLNALVSGDVESRLNTTADYLFGCENCIRTMILAVDGLLLKITEREDLFRDLFALRQMLQQFELSFSIQRADLVTPTTIETTPKFEVHSLH